MTTPAPSTTFHAEFAWLGGDTVASGVLIEVADGTIVRVAPGVEAPADAVRLRGLTMPGLANTHSHVFHRAIRGRSQSGVTDFWAWRDLMYGVAERLDPESLYALARATYAEMALSGITSVGEFFYLHHDRDGRPYADPNELGKAVIRAAHDAGLRITLLDTCYLQADVQGGALDGVRRRFDDGGWESWTERVDQLKDSERLRIGAAIHSVRAVPRDAIGNVAAYARARGMPLHVHLSEQPAENDDCMEHFGLTPTGLLHEEGVLGENTTAVHATHLTDDDIDRLGSSETTISMCCTTERDLADGIGPAVRLAHAGSPLCVGSDAHMVIDLWEEARAIEIDERLITGRRGHLHASQLAHALTGAGTAAMGWSPGQIATGSPADLITVRLDTPRTAGARTGDVLAHVIFTATAADVTTVVVDGRTVVQDSQHVTIPDVGQNLECAIARLHD